MSTKRHANAGIGADNWLYIVSHALSLYAEEGGAVTIHSGPTGLVVELVGVAAEDSRLYEGLAGLVAVEEADGTVHVH